MNGLICELILALVPILVEGDRIDGARKAEVLGREEVERCPGIYACRS